MPIIESKKYAYIFFFKSVQRYALFLSMHINKSIVCSKVKYQINYSGLAQNQLHVLLKAMQIYKNSEHSNTCHSENKLLYLICLMFHEFSDSHQIMHVPLQ